MAWTVPSDRSVGELITATIWNENLGLAGNSKYLKDQLDTCAVAAAAITKGTIYQNTSGHTQIITVTAWCQNGNHEIEAFVGAASPPTIKCGRVKSGANDDNTAPITIVVPDDYYYEFDGDGDLDGLYDYVATLH